MNTNTITYYYINGTLSVIANGETFNYEADLEKFKEFVIFAKEKEGTPFDLNLKDEIGALFNVTNLIQDFSVKIDNKLSIEQGSLFYDEFEIKGNLADRIVDLVKSGSGVDHLIKFFYNIQSNPNLASRECAFTFLDKNEFPLTEDGCFLGYKAVRSDFKDKFTGTLDNSPGNVVTIDRSEVNDDRNYGCSVGLHVGNFEYVQCYGDSGDNWLVVKVNPRDVVAVPNEDCRKVRVCQYEVIAVVSQDYKLDHTQVYSSEGLSVAPTNDQAPLYDEACDECNMYCDGYDEEGYDRYGYDVYGFDRDGYDVDGYDREGYDRNGYDEDGYDEDGYDEDGYDEDGYDAEGYDIEGYLRR